MAEAGVAGFEAAGHAEVDADPDPVRETKSHLLGGGVGLDELRARQGLGHRLGVEAPAHARLRIQEDLRDLPADAGLPATAEIFDFGEFGHRARSINHLESGLIASRCLKMSSLWQAMAWRVDF